MSSSFKARLQQAKVQLAQADAERDTDPLLPLVAAAVSGFDALSTTAILIMVGMRPTTGNARKVARSMRTLGYVPIVSRLIPPGAAASSACRGWAKSPNRRKSHKLSSVAYNAAGQKTLGAGPAAPTMECRT